MVSTRNHPRNFPPPDVSPAKSGSSGGGSQTTSPTPAPSSTRKRRSTPNRRAGSWVHAPSALTLAWLALSLPLVAWDTGYVLLRPLTMPGGSLQWPLYTPYELYGTIDYIYGWPAWEAHNGFTAAQAWMNVVETALYVAYFVVVTRHGRFSSRAEGRGAPSPSQSGVLKYFSGARTVAGREAGVATVLGFTASVMTLSKTVLYMLNEACSGWRGVGHNPFFRLFFMWIVPNGSWIIVPSYMTYVFGAEILDGLAAAAGAPSPVPQLGAIKDE